MLSLKKYNDDDDCSTIPSDDVKKLESDLDEYFSMVKENSF